MPVDDDALRRLCEPETAAALDLLPVTGTSEGALGLQEAARRRLAELGSPPVPEGVALTVEDDGTRVCAPADPVAGRGILWVHGGGLDAGHPSGSDDHVGAARA